MSDHPNEDEAMVHAVVTNDIIVASIVTAWRRDTNWDEFGKEVGVILATAGLTAGTVNHE